MSKRYKRSLQQLLNEEDKYKDLYKTLEENVEKHQNIKQKSFNKIDEIVRFLESIRNYPIEYLKNNELYEIKNNLDKSKAQEIDNKKKKNELLARNGLILTLFAGNTLFFSFKNYFKKFIKGKKFNELVICLLFSLIVYIVYLFSKYFRNLKACAEISNNFYKLREENKRISSENKLISRNNDFIEFYLEEYESVYDSIKHLYGSNYNCMDKKDKNVLKNLINETKIFLSILNEN